jgi:hypothetical protein
MKAYDIYYNSQRINTYPINKETLIKVLNQDYIYKKNNINNQLEKIPTNKLTTRSCIIV